MNCRCFDCRRRRGLEAVAPTLVAAYRAKVAAERDRHRRIAQARDDLLRAERLFAHRELHMIRAGTTGNRRYIAERHRKLAKARSLRDMYRARLKELLAA